MRRGPCVLAIAALAAAPACKAKNPLYCADADNPYHLCDFDSGALAVDTREAGADQRPAADATDARTGCGSDRDCVGDPGGPACDMARRVCVACTGNDHCRSDGGSNVCDQQSHVCYPCVLDGDCGGTTPICHDHACRGCRTDAECTSDPKICADDGRCVQPGEVIYVKKGTSCPGNGSLTQPYCVPADGVAALTPTKRVMILIGPDLLPAFSISGGSAGSIFVVGQQMAAVAGGAADMAGIEISGGATVSIRGLRAASSLAGAGIYVHGNNTSLRLDRCRIENNAKGGIYVDTAAVDITNTIVAGNMSTSSTGCGGWAGVCLNYAANGSRFLNNTVVSNSGTGVACNATGMNVTGSILSGNTPNSAQCTVTTCCSETTPGLTSDYHLAPGSVCIDQLDKNAAAPDDIDGQSRPYGSMSDCGADEYYGP